MMKNQVQQARQRAFRHQYEDGLFEIAQGATFLLLGLFFWAMGHFQAADTERTVLIFASLAFSALLALGMGVFLARYKKRVTYPRAGQVSPQEQPQDELRNGLIAILLAAGIVVAAILLPGQFVNTATIIGATLTAISLSIALRSKLLRMQLVAIVPLLLSVVLTYLGWDTFLAAAVTLAGTGLVGLLTGALALRSFLAAHPLAAEES